MAPTPIPKRWISEGSHNLAHNGTASPHCRQQQQLLFGWFPTDALHDAIVAKVHL